MIKHRRDRARHPTLGDRARQLGNWADYYTKPDDGRINNLTRAEQAYVVSLFSDKPQEFKQWVLQWRAKNPDGTLNLAAMLGNGVQQDIDFSAYSPVDFVQINLFGVRFNNSRFSDNGLFKELKDAGAKFGGQCAIGDRILQPPIKLTNEQHARIQRALLMVPENFAVTLGPIRDQHPGRIIDLGHISISSTNLGVLTPHDFRDLQLSGLSIGNVSLSPELHDFLLSKGVEFTGWRKIGEERFVPAPLSAIHGIDTLLSDENREGFLRELGIIARLRDDPLQLINLGLVQARFANLCEFKPDDFKGCFLRGMELSNVDVTSALKQFFDRAGVQFINGVTVDGKKMSTPDQVRYHW